MIVSNHTYILNAFQIINNYSGKYNNIQLLYINIHLLIKTLFMFIINIIYKFKTIF